MAMANLEIPTTEDIRDVIRAELEAFFSRNPFQRPEASDEIGRGARFASAVTGKSVPTIYSLVSQRQLPHSKRGKDLYFSRKELEEWLKSGKRRSESELPLEAGGR